MPGLVRERFVTGADGVRLYVTEYGPLPRRGGPETVLLLHGYPDSHEVWSPVAERLAARFHVVCYDVRGHGRSAAPSPLRGGFTLEKLTEDFLAVARAVSPDRPLHLVGHDWGSVQGWEFATVPATDGRIASFTSVSGPCLDHFGHWLRERARHPTPARTAQLLGQSAKSWYVYALHTPVLPELAWRGPLGRAWPRLLSRAERIPPQGSRGSQGYPSPSLPRDAANGTWLYRDNVRRRLGRPRQDAFARVPVQLVTPTKDAFLSARLYDDLERWVPHLIRRTLPARHWVPRSSPDHLTRWITDFVDDVSSGEEHGPNNPALPAEPPTPPTPPALPASIERPGPADPPRSAAGDGSGTEPGTRSGARLGTRTGRRAVAARERFAGRLVVVTGAASGIGRATALEFARAGARVVAVDRDADGAARTARDALAKGAREAWPEEVDVSDGTAMAAFAERSGAERGVPDVVVNNAGIGLAGPFLDTTPEDWKQVLDVNLWGVIHGCRLFGRQMAERGEGGHIVNTASAAAFQPSRSLPAYSTSKAAVLMLSECLRAELAPLDIGVSVVCPGLVDTPITRSARHTGVSAEEQDRRRESTAKLYRLRNYPPEKVARAVLRAVLRNTAVVPVTPEARGARLISRVSPRLLRGLARVDPPL
ncbi:SDR family oxidoreductase [Actinacidiphila yeochonensis]|uniref:SDR family oxidoreductase n=1 Tax=Actinacidiphila yeochonensis TaxID=89050 RepID=UPI0005645F56|nr:SDR family oxidoreductase [Actinacidiphila yeochonensis]